MRVKRNKEENKEKKDLTKKIGIGSSSAIGAGIGAASGYGLSEIGKERVGKKAYDKKLKELTSDIERTKEALRNTPKEQADALIASMEAIAKSKAKKAEDQAKKSLGRRTKYILPAAGIGAVIGGVGYNEITKRKGRNRRNENPETK